MSGLTFPADLQQFLRDEVASGTYGSEEELVVEAVRQLRDRRLEQLRAEIQKGLESLDRGEAVEIEDDAALGVFFDEIEAEVRAELAARKQAP